VVILPLDTPAGISAKCWALTGALSYMGVSYGLEDEEEGDPHTAPGLS
jgi:hypothetical protein